MHRAWYQSLLQSTLLVRHVSIMLLAFVLGMAWTPLCADAAIPSPPRYDRAKADLEKLYKDERRQAWREPWQKLGETFYDIYVKEKDWPNRPAALFRSALAFDELSRRSFIRKDAQSAYERYVQVADAHRINPLADDALLAAAKVQVERLGDMPGALRTVDRLCSVYPRSQECREGREYIKQNTQDVEEPKPKKPTAQMALEQPVVKASSVARINTLAWSTKGAVVRVELTLDKACAWELRSSPGSAKSGSMPTLTLELLDARPDASVTPGGKITGSSLKRVRLDYHKSSITRLLLDYSKLERFSIREENDGKKLTIETTIMPSALPGGLAPGNVIRSQRAAAAERRAAQTSSDSSAFWVATHNLASQFGLNVRTIIIDPGHGGKDPGTHHNGILEREVVLDLAKRLGKRLQADGYDVKFTRTKDTWISLNGRTEFANKQKGDLFVSLHINASTNPKKVGLETYYLDVSSSTAAASIASFENMLSNRKLGDLEKMIGDLMLGARKDESIRLARDVQQKTIQRLARTGYTLHNGGSRGAPFVVLMGTTMPAVLVEASYCSNKQEAKLLASSAFRNALVQGISDGVNAYAERLRSSQRR